MNLIEILKKNIFGYHPAPSVTFIPPSFLWGNHLISLTQLPEQSKLGINHLLLQLNPSPRPVLTSRTRSKAPRGELSAEPCSFCILHCLQAPSHRTGSGFSTQSPLRHSRAILSTFSICSQGSCIGCSSWLCPRSVSRAVPLTGPTTSKPQRAVRVLLHAGRLTWPWIWESWTSDVQKNVRMVLTWMWDLSGQPLSARKKESLSKDINPNIQQRVFVPLFNFSYVQKTGSNKKFKHFKLSAGLTSGTELPDHKSWICWL